MRGTSDNIVFLNTELNNSVGVVVCVISTALTLMFAFVKRAADDGQDILRYGFMGAIFLFGLLLILFRKKITILPNGPSIEIEQGFWPFMSTKPATFALAEKLTVLTFATKSGHGYTVVLEYSDDRRLRLTRTLDAKELAKVARLSKATGLPIEVKGGLNDTPDDPAWDQLGMDPPAPRI